jgi:hypothetical protein
MTVWVWPPLSRDKKSALATGAHHGPRHPHPVPAGLLRPQHGTRPQQPAVGQQLDPLWLPHRVRGRHRPIAGVRRDDCPGLGGAGGGATNLRAAVLRHQDPRRGLPVLPRLAIVARRPGCRKNFHHSPRGHAGTGPAGIPGRGRQAQRLPI